MEALGVMTGGIAHNFNNMLTSVVGGLGLLERQELNDRSRRYLTLAQSSVDRAVKLTNRLLSFSRLRILNPTLVEANSLIQSLQPLLERTLDEKVDISIIPFPAKLYLEVDVEELESCLINLCINDRDALTENGEIEISVSERHMAETSGEDHHMAEGDYVVITVQVNGMEMDDKTRQKAFDPFFTTKAVGKGSGLGLSMVFGFARQSGGNITIDSELGKGTGIKLYFPQSRKSESSVEQSSIPTAGGFEFRHSSGEKILLVEDDREIRKFAVLALEDLGYDVVVACDGQEALNQFQGHPDIDLLFVDIVMPGELNGVQVSDHFRSKFPGKPVLYTSGYTRNTILPGDILPEGSSFLSKPYSLQQLSSALFDILGPSTLM